MDRRLVLIVLVSVIIVSSTRSVFTRATPSGEAGGDDKREEGVSKPAGAIEEIDRKGCIMQAAAHLGAFNMDEEMGARLEDARNFYFLEHYAGKYSNQNKPLERPVGCKTLIYNHDIIHSAVPCFSNSTVMGPVRDKQSMVQLAVDLIRATDESKLAMELYYACHDGRGAGDEMRLDGVFEAITGRSADRGLVRKPTRDECIEQAADFYNQVVINDKIKAHSKLAKDYYFKTLDRTSSKKAPKAPEDCERLNDRMSSFESVVPCYGDHTVMGPSKELNFTAVHRRTQAIRMAYEAWFACKGSLFAGQGLKAKGIFMATLGGIEM